MFDWRQMRRWGLRPAALPDEGAFAASRHSCALMNAE